jgi:hypothetical protein
VLGPLFRIALAAIGALSGVDLRSGV